MDIFAMMLGLVLVVASGMMVAMPLLKKQGVSYSEREEIINSEDSTEKKKEVIFSILNEIEFDYKTNKLSQEDYEDLKNKYRKQALAFIKDEEDGQVIEIDEDRLEAEIEAEIEAEVEKMREK